MDNFISISIYLIYLIIATLSIVIAKHISIVICLIVIALEYIRIIAIYKKVYVVMIIIFFLNVFLISYTSFKDTQRIEEQNQIINNNNKTVTKYVNNNNLRATTLQNLLNPKQYITQVVVDYQLIIGVYIALELSLLLLIYNLEKQKKKNIKTSKPKSLAKKSIVGKKLHALTSVIPAEKLKKADPNNLTYVGSYREYAQSQNISREKAKEVFAKWSKEGLLHKISGKNYVSERGNNA